MTVVLAIAACGDILPPMIIFLGITDLSFKDLEVPDNFCIITQEKTWMDERLMMVWYEKTWVRKVHERTK